MTWKRFVLARDSLECEVNYVMSNTKKKFAFWLTPKTKELVERSYQLDNSQSQSEFIEKAIQFYTGYLEAEQDGSYLPVTLSATLEGSLGALGDRLGKVPFKMSGGVFMNMSLINRSQPTRLGMFSFSLFFFKKKKKNKNNKLLLKLQT